MTFSPRSLGKISNIGSNRSQRGFTLVEILMAMIIFMIVIAALFSTVFAALKLYYVNSDYLDIGGQTRRLLDDMVESGTFSDDLAIFTDMSDKVAVLPKLRGDVLMFFSRSADDDKGNINKFTCYYLAKTPPVVTGSRPISLWRIVGTCSNPALLTAIPKEALNVYTTTPPKRVTGTILNDTLPRNTLDPRPGIFTNAGVQVAGGTSPTVLVNLPASMIIRAPNIGARSNVTVAISPRH